MARVFQITKTCLKFRAVSPALEKRFPGTLSAHSVWLPLLLEESVLLLGLAGYFFFSESVLSV